MDNEPLVWHYGLMAEYWAEFINETPELDFLLEEVNRSGQPVLDLGCGTGRLMVPLLQAGVDIDGCDISADMLSHARRKANAAGLEPQLICAPMHAFNAPRRYKTIYIAGSFGLSGSRPNDLETLRRCYAHLQDGGVLLFTVDAEYTSPDVWQTWTTPYAQTLPLPWPDQGSSKTTVDGNELRLFVRRVHIDPLEQSFTNQVRLEKWRGDERLACEEYTLRGQCYLKPEVQLMLQVAGFDVVEVTGDYTKEPADMQHEQIVFRAVKKAKKA